MNIIYTTTIFDKWFSEIRDNMIKRRLQARIDRIEDGHFGDCKPVGSGVPELRCFLVAVLEFIIVSEAMKL